MGVLRSSVVQPLADEQALREREALLTRRHKSAALAYLAGGVAHDLNNLLTVIVGAADLLGEDPHVEEAQRAELRAIQRAGERASEITRQLLAYSRREPSVPRELGLERSVRELAPVITRMLGPAIELELTFGPELWPVRLDPLHAEQVVTHLMLHARQAMPHGGVARLSLHNVHIERLERRGPLMVGAGDYVELCVRDTGVGMNAASIARAFEPFFAAREQPASTDLSLPLVRNFVAHALGHIWIESEPGAGTLFHVLLPRFDERRASAAPPDPYAPVVVSSPPRLEATRAPKRAKNGRVALGKVSSGKGSSASSVGRGKRRGVRHSPARG
jgi:two-component system cell cycle sensor histidine kinase/response regulator CckA